VALLFWGAAYRQRRYILLMSDNKNNISAIIQAFKSLTTTNYIQNVTTNNWMPFNKKLWQKNYYEHIIRDEE